MRTRLARSQPRIRCASTRVSTRRRSDLTPQNHFSCATGSVTDVVPTILQLDVTAMKLIVLVP